MHLLLTIEILIGMVVALLLWQTRRAARDSKELLLYILRKNERTKEQTAAQISGKKQIEKFDGFNKMVSDTMRRERLRVARTVENMPEGEKEAFDVLSDELGKTINGEIRKNS
jgi:endonuclease/exonuclease/phosphatase (EEP) superfamily protein YafD